MLLVAYGSVIRQFNPNNFVEIAMWSAVTRFKVFFGGDTSDLNWKRPSIYLTIDSILSYPFGDIIPHRLRGVAPIGQFDILLQQILPSAWGTLSHYHGPYTAVMFLDSSAKMVFSSARSIL